MDAEKRKIFWDTLCSLPGKDITKEFQTLNNAITFPKYLYRYRPVTINSLEALRTNRLYFSSANYYDDPFDTFLHIDIEKIKAEYLDSFETVEGREALLMQLKEIYKNTLSNEQIQQLTLKNLEQALSNGLVDNFLLTALQLRNEVKKDIWSICFSENGFNETLWLKYAEQHKGFALIYDLENSDNMLCGKQEKCENCGIYMYGTALYPIYYSDEPYDATNYAKIVMLRKMEEIYSISCPEWMHMEFGNGMWERERTTLIKKKCHEYDEEWRMITNCSFKPPVMREWIPHGIILGLRMGNEETNIVVSMAKEAGIKNIYKSFINAKNELSAYKCDTTTTK